MITNNCNYNCSFCDRKKRHIISNELNINEIDVIIKFLNEEIYQNNENTSLELNGGEPTISPYFFHILDNIICKNILLITNLSCNIDFIKKLIKSNKKISIMATYHSLYEKEDIFIEKIKFLIENNIDIIVKFTIEKSSEDFFNTYYLSIINKLLKYHLKMIISSANHIPIFNGIENMFKNIKIRYDQKINDKYNQLCGCYNQNMTIYSNGEIYPCLSAIYSDNPLYNILEKNNISKHKIFKKIEIKCPMNWCCGEYII
jgi:organic radical activating enzyme